jgi:hypothetical protein
MDKALPVGQLLADQRLTHGRCVNNLAHSRVGELGAGDTVELLDTSPKYVEFL